MKKTLSLVLALLMLVSLCACGVQNGPGSSNGENITVTDMVGRQVEILPGSYKRVVCIGAGALRMYSYIGDVALLAGVDKKKLKTVNITIIHTALITLTVMKKEI